MKKFLIVIAIIVVICGFKGVSTYNSIQSQDEAVKAGWSQVVNVYKRRADLVPNLVATVKGYATHEEDTFVKVTEARSKVGQIKVDANDAKSLAAFSQAQGELSSALSRLMAVSESYPQLKANQNFLELQAQLEGSENRISVERRRYIQTVQAYNTYIRSFPNNLIAGWFHYSEKPNFAVQNEAQISEPPAIDFNAPNGVDKK
jgi:LemA protein